MCIVKSQVEVKTMIETKVKVLGAITYLNWIFYLVSYIVFRETTVSYQEESFYNLHSYRALFIHIIATISGFVLSRTVFGNLYSYGSVTAVCGIFALWGLLYAAMGKTDKIPVLDDILDLIRN